MVLAVDLGQSGARLRWDGGNFESPRAKRVDESTLDALADIFREVQIFYGGTLHSDIVCLSLTSLYGDVPDPRPYGELAGKFFSANQVAVMDDGLAGFVGALGTDNGVVLSIGSGVVAIADHQGQFAHSDGLGHLFGDLGGGFWLGRQGLARALASRQGREIDDELLAHLHLEMTQHDELESVTGQEAYQLCVSAAKTVLEAAHEKIESALAIRALGVHHLVQTVLSAWINAGGGVEEPLSLSLLGGLSRDSEYAGLIVEGVATLLPNSTLVPARGDHLDGAVAVASTMNQDVHPLLRWWSKT